MTTMTPPTRHGRKLATLHLTRDYDWRDDASCSLVEDDAKDIFFPVGTSASALNQEAAAKRICGICPVRAECLEWALETGQYTGVWGGLSERERRELHADSVSSFQRCLEEQAYIEERQAKKVSVREVAREVGVSYEVMRRAIRLFEAEKAQAVAEVKAA